MVPDERDYSRRTCERPFDLNQTWDLLAHWERLHPAQAVVEKEIQGKLKKSFLESSGEKDLARQGLELGQMDSDLTHVFVPNITGLCLYSMSLSFPTDSSAPLPVLLLRKDGRFARQMRTSLLYNYSRGMAPGCKVGTAVAER